MTSTVQLIVTGELEKAALARALNNAFPMLAFPAPLKFEGFTSGKVQPVRGMNTPVTPNIMKLANALVASVLPKRRHEKPPDMAILIDDLELENIQSPETVTAQFRHAVLQAMDHTWGPLEKYRQKVREQCSFHLFVPMTEAYFFGDPKSLERAEARRKSTVDGDTTDVEQFHVTQDPAFLSKPSTEDCYWAAENRARHPKHYLEYLCDPECNSKRNGYKETRNGKRALEGIEWHSVCSAPTRVRFLRSLFEDIAWRFDLPNPCPGECAEPTEFKGDGAVLRNI